MKLKTQEKIRLVELGAIMGLTGASILVKEGCLLEEFSQHELLIKQVNSALINAYSYDCLLSYRTQRLTDEYKELKVLYQQVTKNTKDMMKSFGAEDPISIFAMFVFLLRKGYLSYNNKFTYDTDMKDFALLCGIDVVRGTGVCRSISSMLNDVYHDFGMNSHCLGVSAKDSSFSREKNLSEIKLEKSHNSEAFVDAVMAITTLFRRENHMVTSVSDDKYNYVFDATNDEVFYVKGRKLINISDYKAVMYRGGFSSTIMGVVGQMDVSLNPIKNHKQYNLPHVDYEEYKEIYLEAVSLLKDNLDIVEDFYEQNSPLYKDIVMICSEQNNLIHRLLPFLPTGREKKKIKK